MASEMAAEFEDHIRRHTEEQIRRGVSPADAARRARLDFGGVEAIKEECREARGVRLNRRTPGDLLRIAEEQLSLVPPHP